MATLAHPGPAASARESFWPISAALMMVLLIAGFSVQVAMGRSTFAAPLYVHAHALLFFGWAVLYLAQNLLVGTGNIALHKRLGWLSVLWIPAMLALGLIVTVAMVRRGGVPFFFQPLYFLVMDPLTLLVFAGLAATAIRLRRRTQWHRRLMFCGMAILMGPGIGRLIPMPLLIPYAGWAVFAVVILFPIAGIARDLRREGRVHPAWWWGLGTIVVMQFGIDLLTFSPLGQSLYALATQGSPGATIAPLAFPPFPGV